MLLSNFVSDERIFIDANIFIYHALDDPMFADSSSDFLRKVETNKIKGVITPHVMDEVLFKILVAEAAQHLEKFTLPNLKKEMKKPSFSSMVYKPVREYSDYITELTFSGLKILIVDAGVIEKSLDLSRLFCLRPRRASNDFIHGVPHLAGFHGAARWVERRGGYGGRGTRRLWNSRKLHRKCSRAPKNILIC